MINFYFANVDFKSALGLVVSAVFQLFSLKNNIKSPNAKCFRESCAETIGFGSLVLTSSNRSGLFSLLTALNVGEDDEVMVTGFTCAAVVEPVVARRAKPIYVDINPLNYCLNPDLIEALITSRTRVIILQHTFGIPGPIEMVIEIARRYGLFVIEDCALAFGSKKDGRWLGTFGDAAVWSFELSKTISVGWGGLIAINGDQALVNRIKVIVDSAGIQSRLLTVQRLLQGGGSGILYHHATPRVLQRYGLAALFKFGIFRRSAETPASDLRLPSDRQWKYLNRQLQRLDTILLKSHNAQIAYQSVLLSHGCDFRSVFGDSSGTYLIRFPFLVGNPDRFVAFFAARDIEAGRWFSSPVSCGGESPLLYGYEWGACPVAEKVCRHIVNLPLHGRLTPVHVGWVAESLDIYLSNHPDEVAFIRRSLTSNSFGL